MRVGLIDVDSHNFPNLCLMKLSEYHTRRGDRVEWWNPAKQYDLVYKSRVFTDTYSKDTIQVNNADTSSSSSPSKAQRSAPTRTIMSSRTRNTKTRMFLNRKNRRTRIEQIGDL